MGNETFYGDGLMANLKNRKKLQLIKTIWEVMALLTVFDLPLETTCSCKQDTKERYWGQQFWQTERHISVRPTEMTRPVTVDHLQIKLVPNSLNILVAPNRNGPFHLMNQPKFPEFWVEWKAPLKTTSTNGFNFRIINSFMISCGVRLTWLDVRCSRMS